MLKIISAPLNLGYRNPHTAKFPELIKPGLARMLKYHQIQWQDLGGIKIPSVKKKSKASEKLKNYQPVLNFNCQLADLASSNSASLQDFILTIGGDHSISLGSISGLSVNRRLGVLWLDAHCDAHTPETTHTGWIYGMPLAAICGIGDRQLTGIAGPAPRVNPENCCVFGARYYEDEEITNLKALGVKIITMDDVIAKGLGPCIKQAISILDKNTDSIHLGFDLDSIDEFYAPGVSEPSKGMFTYRELTYIFNQLHQTGKVKSMDVCEYDYAKDIDNQTLNLAIELIAKILGKDYSEYDIYMEKNKVVPAKAGIHA